MDDTNSLFPLDLRGYETVFQLSLHKSLFEKLYGQLNLVHTEAITDLESQYKVDSQEEREEFSSIRSSFENYQEDEQQVLFSTNLIQLYTLFENESKRLSQSVKSEKKLKLKLEDCSSQGGLVSKLRIYLATYSNLLPNDHLVWNRIDALRIVRNYLVHDGHSKYEVISSGQLKKLHQKNPNLYLLTEHSELQLTKDLCEHFHSDVTNFFKLAYNKLGWKTFKNEK
ncbi:hypothetical protein [Rubritalea sp.]|uniref:hypothetical protein n=1 Tax=Rubritalea sp. TaxID=2109375 RepID=UPI003EF99013